MAKRGPKGPSKYTPAFIEAQAEALMIYADKALALGKFPNFAGFCALQGIDRQRLQDWIDEKNPNFNEEFLVAFKTMKSIMENDLIQGMLESRYAAAPAIFTAKNVLGWRDEQYLKGEGFSNIMQVVIPKNYKPKNPKNRLLQKESNASLSAL